jgi:hypothetical protein
MRPWWHDRLAQLGDACRAWPYWIPRIVLLVVLVFAAVFVPIGIEQDAWPVLSTTLVVLLVAFWIRNRVASLPRRALALSAVLVLVVVSSTPRWWSWFVGAIAVIALAVLLRRYVGSLRPRFLGVPRPDASDERFTPLEATSDDGEVLVDALDSLWGSTRLGGPRYSRRAVHNHGSGACGGFWPATTDTPADIALFAGGQPLAAVARFSNFSGTIHRDDSLRAPHGMALKVGPSKSVCCALGAEDDPVGGLAGIDFVLVDIRRFPVSNRDDFYGFIRRYGRWVRFGLFWAMDRTRLNALKGMVPFRRPASYLTRRYHGLNTFHWNDEPVRYLAVPGRRRRSPTTGDRRWRLDRDLRERLRQGPVDFELRLVRGRGLPLGLQLDARRAWPRLMRYWSIGTLRLDTYIPPDEIDVLHFDPHRLPIGVEPSADEILMARRAAYPESQLRRCPV